MAANKKKYPKGFYDDGLGDILEWIDDEILAEPISGRAKSKTSGDQDTKGAKSGKRKKNKSRISDDGESRLAPRRQVELYGDNDLDEIDRKAASKKLKTVEDLDEAGDEIVKKPDKKLEDKARGLINRLAAPTMPFVSSEFEKLYATHPRSSVNSALFNNIDSSLISRTAIAKRKIVAELMLLASYLSHKISHNIGASLVHHLVIKFEQLYKQDLDSTTTSEQQHDDEEKRLDNITFCLANLYIIGLISGNVVFEFTKRICSPKDFRPKSVELLLIVLKNIGFQLRKDNPAMMRQLILMALEQCKQLKQLGELDTRIEFMVEALNAIKNNNISKIGNYGCDIDKDTIESTLKGLIKRIRLPETLCDALYDDILNSANFHLLDTRLDEEEESAVAGASAATSGGNGEKSNKPAAKLNFVGTKMEAKICKALGLNKPAERTILSALLKVTDYVEASNIVIGFGMNHCSDALVVCVHVAIHEKKYNPFYYNLINNLCKFHRKYKMAAKFAIQDKIRALSGMASQRVDVFKRLTFELIKSDAVPITVLKSVEWASLDQSTKEYLSYLLSSISALSDEERAQIMLKSDKRSSFAGAMRTFTNCFLKDCQLFQ